MNLEYLIVPENKKVLKMNTQTHKDESMSKKPSEKAFKSQSWNNLSDKINLVVLDYIQSMK